MPASPVRPRSQRTGAAIALAGLLLTASIVPAAAEPSHNLGFRTDPAPTSRSRTIKLPGGDQVITSLQAATGRSVLTPVHRPDGSSPGLLLSSSTGATTIQATDRHLAPTTLAGHPRTRITSSGDGFDLRLNAIGRDGRSAGGFVSIYDVRTGAVQAARQLTAGLSHECTTATWAVSDCITLPSGTYSIMAFVETNPPSVGALAESRTLQSVALVGDPQVELGEGRTVTFDARKAVPLTVRTPGHRTKITPEGAMQFGYRRTAANGQQIDQVYRPTSLLDRTFYSQPTERVTVGDLDTLTRVRLEAPDITMRTVSGRPTTLHPEYYDKVWFSDLATDWPTFDGAAVRRVVDVGHADATDLESQSLRRSLHGAIAVAERSDELSVAAQSNAAAAAGASMIVIYNDKPGDNDDPNGTGVKISIPTLRISRAEGLKLVRLSGHGSVLVAGENASPYLYDLVIKESGRIPSDLHYSFGPGQLSVQRRQLYGQPSTTSTFSEAAYQFQPGDTFSISTMFPFPNGPRTRTEYRLPDPNTTWTYAVSTPERPYNAMFPHDPVLPMLLSDPLTTAYTPRQRVDKPIGTAPVSAAPGQPVQRSGDQMRIAIDGFTDADGNHGPAYSTDSGMSTMLQIRVDGQLIGETPNLPSGVATLPSGSSKINIAFQADNPQSWTQLSTHTESSWTFDSATTADNEIVTAPLILTDYDLNADLRNRLHRRTFDLTLHHQAGSTTDKITAIRLDASLDDGTTWRPTKITKRPGRGASDGSRYRIKLPSGHGPVSLRLHAVDAAGSSLDQTIIRAVWVR
jgi:hypothetical protein